MSIIGTTHNIDGMKIMRTIANYISCTVKKLQNIETPNATKCELRIQNGHHRQGLRNE